MSVSPSSFSSAFPITCMGLPAEMAFLTREATTVIPSIWRGFTKVESVSIGVADAWSEQAQPSAISVNFLIRHVFITLLGVADNKRATAGLLTSLSLSPVCVGWINRQTAFPNKVSVAKCLPRWTVYSSGTVQESHLFPFLIMGMNQSQSRIYGFSLRKGHFLSIKFE